MVTVDDIGLPEKQQQQLINYSVGNPPFNYNIFPQIAPSFQSTLIAAMSNTNQPMWGNTGTRYRDDRRDDYHSNDSKQFVSRSLSRHDNEFDRRDSRVSSYSNRWSDHPRDDRREFQERWRSDRREDRGPPRAYDDDRRRNEGRFDDRKRSGGGGSRGLCKFFFTPGGCRYGSGCRFSHREQDSAFEDRGSEDREGRPIKRFRGPDRNIATNGRFELPPAAHLGNPPPRVRLPFEKCRNIDDVLKLVIEHIGNLRLNQVAAAWSCMFRLLSEEHHKHHDPEHREQQLHIFLQHTVRSIDKLRSIDLTTIIHSMAKIKQSIREAQERREMNIYHLALGSLFQKSNPFGYFANAADRILMETSEFDARCMSNLAYAYALVGYNPTFEDGSSLLEKIGVRSITCITQFTTQGLSNIVWAYATNGMQHTALFNKVADHVVALDHLKSFSPQALANTVWAYATAGIQHPALFNKVADHVVATGVLKSFNPQALANTVWAYATAGIQHPALFNKVSGHVTALDKLKPFTPQGLSNIVWAYATNGMQHTALFSKVGDHVVELNNLKSFDHQALANTVWAYATAGFQHHHLFKRIGDHIIVLVDLKSFKPQDFSNTVWAFAKAGMQHPDLFSKVGDHIVASDNLKFFTPQNLSNTVWAYATANELRADLFEKICIALANRMEFQSFDPQALANIAWAYAVANAHAPMIFNNHFTNALLVTQHDFGIEERYQLHQWHLWQINELSHAGLPEELRERCYQAFVGDDTTVSRFQKDVVRELRSIDLEPVEEFITSSGYSIDALVEVNGKSIGIEVDGPSHFINKMPSAKTMLKRRQITAIDKIPLVSVPYWEWNELGKDRVKKQQYLKDL
jgi:hypothetical protein